MSIWWSWSLGALSDFHDTELRTTLQEHEEYVVCCKYLRSVTDPAKSGQSGQPLPVMIRVWSKFEEIQHEFNAYES